MSKQSPGDNESRANPVCFGAFPGLFAKWPGETALLSLFSTQNESRFPASPDSNQEWETAMPLQDDRRALPGASTLAISLWNRL